MDEGVAKKEKELDFRLSEIVKDEPPDITIDTDAEGAISMIGVFLNAQRSSNLDSGLHPLKKPKVEGVDESSKLTIDSSDDYDCDADEAVNLIGQFLADTTPGSTKERHNRNGKRNNSTRKKTDDLSRPKEFALQTSFDIATKVKNESFNGELDSNCEDISQDRTSVTMKFDSEAESSTSGDSDNATKSQGRRHLEFKEIYRRNEETGSMVRYYQIECKSCGWLLEGGSRSSAIAALRNHNQNHVRKRTLVRLNPPVRYVDTEKPLRRRKHIDHVLDDNQYNDLLKKDVNREPCGVAGCDITFHCTKARHRHWTARHDSGEIRELEFNPAVKPIVIPCGYKGCTATFNSNYTRKSHISSYRVTTDRKLGSPLPKNDTSTEST